MPVRARPNHDDVRTLPDATLAVIENVGHCPHMSAPSACADAIDAFLAARLPDRGDR